MDGCERPASRSGNLIPQNIRPYTFHGRVSDRWSRSWSGSLTDWATVDPLCLTKHHVTKTHWGGGIASRILDLSTRWRWVVRSMPRPLYPQAKNPWYTLDMKLGGPQSLSGRGGEEKNSQPPLGIEPPNSDCPAHSQSLYRLFCHGS
jgi:hypothetical protein